MQNSNKLEQLKSWVITFIADFAVEILVGLGVIIQTGELTKAALLSLATASLRTAIKLTLEYRAEEIKRLKDKKEEV